MIVDTSVLICILINEQGAEHLFELIVKANWIGIPSPVLLEASLVLLRKGLPEHIEELDHLIKTIDANILPFTEEMALYAREAYQKYGKGQGHPAQLNFGDCMVYAAAKAEDIPLLFVGDDFAKTDVQVAGDV